MKRSEINAIIKDFESKLREFKFALPPFLSFTPEEWAEKGHEYDEIRDNALGWDITDYGEGHFDTLGLSLITIRNGNVHNSKYTKTYAEKIMMLREGQVSPNHFHWNKMEDIINRGGGNLVFRLWNATKDEGLDDTDVEICRTALYGPRRQRDHPGPRRVPLPLPLLLPRVLRPARDRLRHHRRGVHVQ